jgi:Heterokaryon incompatibility protein Het-C
LGIGCTSPPRNVALFKCFFVRLMDSRDYSQAVDVGTLSKEGLDIHMIRLLVWVLGYLSFGFATEEFEVRLQSRRCPFKDFGKALMVGHNRASRRLQTRRAY